MFKSKDKREQGSHRKKDLLLFVSLTFLIFAQAVWWIVFMARLIDEKVEMAAQFGADEEFVQALHDQEVNRQIMVGLEGLFFLILILAGAWLIYRSLIKAEELKFHQQNFLMAVTHELKTPLASLRIYLQSLSSTKISEEKKSGILPKMTDEVGRLEKLVGNILDAGRFERSGYKLNREQHDLSKLVERQIDKFASIPTKVELRIEKQLTLSLEYNGDQRALGQAIDAILENGIKYNQSDPIELKVSLIQDGKVIELAIQDNGIGLIKADISRVFNRFYRVGDEMNRSYAGTGLGLFLAREIVRQHGGDITASSDGLNQGTTFKLTLKAENNETVTAG